MAFIYNLGIFLYGLFIRFAALFNPKAKQFVVGRKALFLHLKDTVVSSQLPVVWFHCASLGEFEQARTLIEAYKAKHPDCRIILTFFSPSGFEVRKNYPHADYIFYLPIDTPRNARRFINIVKPQKVFFIKYEFWYNYLNILSKRRIAIYLVSANFRENQLFFKKRGAWYRSMLQKFKHIYVQNERSIKLLESIEILNASIAGDTRFDRVAQIASQTKQIPIVERFAGNNMVFIAGSTWPTDELLIVQYINQSQHQLKYIIASHEIHETQINTIIQGITSKKCIRFSQANENTIHEFDVLIIDNIGMLSSLYKYGKISYIGGGFGKGIHNTLEAATFGLPVIFGPCYTKFQEALDLVEQGGAYPISNFKELKHTIDSLIENPQTLVKASNAARQLVESNVGATGKIIATC